MDRSPTFRFPSLSAFASACLLFLAVLAVYAEDSPQWGQHGTRNMVSPETNLPTTFKPGTRDPGTGLVDPSTTADIRWAAPLGPVVYGTPVIAEGRVLIGTNGSLSAAKTNRPALEGDQGVLVCLDEKSGEFLWELVVPKMHEIRYSDWYHVGMTSTPAVENGRAYLVTNRNEVVCLDLEGLRNGNDGPYLDEARHLVAAAVGNSGPEPLPLTEYDADILWLTDLVLEVGAAPHNAANCSVLIDGDFLYVATGNGVDWTHRRVMNPEAPSLVVLDKRTGKILARDRFGIGPNIMHGQWSSPALGEHRLPDGTLRRVVYLGTGSGYLFAVEALKSVAPEQSPLPETGKSPDAPLPHLKTLWKFNGHPRARHQAVVPMEHFHDTRSYEMVANPVVVGDRLYGVFTQELYHNLPDGQVVCLDLIRCLQRAIPERDGSGAGVPDVTREDVLLWTFSKEQGMKSSGSTVAVADGLLYVADNWGSLHCLDADTGKPCWTHKVGAAPVWGSPLLADGKVHLGIGRRTFWVLKHGREPEVLARITMPDKVLASASAANGVLFIPVFGTLYAAELLQDETVPGKTVP